MNETTDRVPAEAAMTRLTGRALRLTVLIGEHDTWHHRPLYSEIVHRAHAAGLAGASVFRGIEGFGASSLIHTSRLLSLSEDLPVAVVIVDSQERVRAFLPQLDELVAEGLVTLDDCEVIRYAGRGEADQGKGENSL
jgi:PII-like signaling protein